MRVLLLGGSGAIGTHLAKILYSLGITVCITSRYPKSTNDKISHIQGNAKDIHFLKKITETNWDAIVDFMNYSEEEFIERINILLSNTDNYCFLSSSRIYANSGKTLLTEKSPILLRTENDEDYLKSNEYGLAKAKEEQVIVNSGKINWTIFRPYIIYSEKRFQLGNLEKEDWLQRVIEGKSIILQKSLCDKYTTLTYSPDAGEIIAAIIMSPKSKSQVYNIVDGAKHSLTWGKIAKIYQEILEKKLCRKVNIKYLTDAQFRKLRTGKSYYQTSHDRMYNRVFDNRKILSFKKEDSFIPLQEGLENSLTKFLKSPKFMFKNYAQEALIDRFTGEHTNISSIPSIKNKLIYLYYRYKILL